MKKKGLVLILFSILLLANFRNSNAQDSLKDRLERHVYTLAQDSLKGREAGSINTQKAAAYIISQWEAIGIMPFDGDSYYQEFRERYRNLVGVIPGSDPVLKDEYIIVGAHYDHIGFKVENGDTIIYNGADDNASGVATLIEVARNLKKNQHSLKRSVLLIAFDAEEIGLYGSFHFAEHMRLSPHQINLMLSIDMVGWYKESGYLEYAGAGTIRSGKDLLLANQLCPEGLHVKTKPFENSVFTATDTEGFAKRGIPTLAVTTGLKSPYHKPEDEAHLIDYNGMTLVTTHVTRLVQHVSQDISFRASGKVAGKHRKTPQRFDWGITGSIGGNHHHYTAGSVNGKLAGAYSVGFLSQLNMGLLAVRTQLLYEHIRAKYPAGTVKTNNLTIPLNLVLQTRDMMSMKADVFAGGYYTHRFDGKSGDEKIDFTDQLYRNEAGINFGAGIKIRHIMLTYTHRLALTNLLRHKHADGANIRNRADLFSITYIF